MPDDVATGGCQFLKTFSDVTSALGAFSVSDPNPSLAGQPFLFSANILVTVKGTQASSCVLTDFGGWGQAPVGGTGRWRRLRVDVYTDPLRDTNNNINISLFSTVNRCLEVFAILHRHLQRRDPDTQLWGDLVTYGCQLLTEPYPQQIPDGDAGGMGVVMGSAVYGVNISGWTDFAS